MNFKVVNVFFGKGVGALFHVDGRVGGGVSVVWGEGEWRGRRLWTPCTLLATFPMSEYGKKSEGMCTF